MLNNALYFHDFFGYLKTLFNFIRLLCVGGNFLVIVIVNPIVTFRVVEGNFVILVLFDYFFFSYS
jgi:hypothetical protein